MKNLGSSSSPGRTESTSSTSFSSENTRSIMMEAHNRCRRESRIGASSSSSGSRRVIESGGGRFRFNSRRSAVHDESALHEYDGSSIPRVRRHHNYSHNLEASPSHVANCHYFSRRNSFSRQLPPLPFTDVSRSRSSQHVDTAVRRSHLPRRVVYSKDVRSLQRQHSSEPRMQEATNPKGKDASTMCSQSQYSAPSTATGAESSLTSSNTPDIIGTGQQNLDTALSRLRLLCTKINAGESPHRSEIKEVVAEYHHSRRQPLSPSNPSFVPIPSEYSKVLAYGMARSQHHDETLPQTPFPTDTSESKINVAALKSRSKFAEFNHEGEEKDFNDSLLHSVIVVGRKKDDDVSCISFPDNLNNVNVD